MTAPAAVASVTRVASVDARRWTLTPFAARVALLGVAALAIGVAIIDQHPVGAAADDAMYVVLARALATGQGFRYINLPGAPAATHFPPGYPALLALLWRLWPAFPANLMLFKLANAALLAVVAMATARLARRRLLSDRWALALGAVTAVSIPLLILGAMLLSELLFLAMVLLLLPALESYVADVTPQISRGVALGLAIGACLLVRTQGIALLGGALMLLLARRRWRGAMALGVAAMACLLPWQLWCARHAGQLPAPLLGEYESYAAWWMRGLREMGAVMIPLTLGRTLAEMGGMLAVLFSPARLPAARIVTLVALLALGAVGARTWWRRAPVTLLFLGGYLAMVALWPFPASRFVWGVWPLVLLLLASGARVVTIGTHAGHWRVLAGAAATGWLAWGYGAYELRGVRGRWWASIPAASARRIEGASRWTARGTAPTDVVAVRDEGAVFLYTGRHTVPVRTFTVQQYLAPLTPRMEAEQGLAPVLAAYPVRAVLADSASGLDAAAWLAAQPDSRLVPAAPLPGGVAFTVLPR